MLLKQRVCVRWWWNLQQNPQEPGWMSGCFTWHHIPKLMLLIWTPYYLAVYWARSLELFKMKTFGRMAGLWHEDECSALTLHTMHIYSIQQGPKILLGLFNGTHQLFPGIPLRWVFKSYHLPCVKIFLHLHIAAAAGRGVHWHRYCIFIFNTWNF